MACHLPVRAGRVTGLQAALDRLAASNGRAADAINADINDRLMEYLYSSKYRPLQARYMYSCKCQNVYAALLPYALSKWMLQRRYSLALSAKC